MSLRDWSFQKLPRGSTFYQKRSRKRAPPHPSAAKSPLELGDLDQPETLCVQLIQTLEGPGEAELRDSCGVRSYRSAYKASGPALRGPPPSYSLSLRDLDSFSEEVEEPHPCTPPRNLEQSCFPATHSTQRLVLSNLTLVG